MSDPMERPQLPISENNVVACRQCGLILTRDQFRKEGCRTCADGEPREDEDVTAKFSGYVGIINGEGSWVARLLSKTDKPAGVYAAQIHGDDDDDDGEEHHDDDDDDDGNFGNGLDHAEDAADESWMQGE
eukprot:TRINITY_DN5792_c0_g2_i1.p1 TRINITY_DN5792_c0_g2~~TRINITY_DN5792_c0_g2_i1.p1  ORF type:complete len:130 (-),score=1.75 TRINITY_DN5792_c0_g2_i1:19-408(-)